jgi:dTMP kinase
MSTLAGPTSGLFITFEGIDGAGKSTHIERLVQQFRAAGRSVVLTREPGGTDLAEQLRGLLLNQDMDAMTEALLVFAARRDHWTRCIQPALKAGQDVICDRFADASFAYQGGGRGLPVQVLQTLEDWVLEGARPDLTLLFDLPAATAAARRAAARAADRFETEDLSFFERVRAAYRERQLAQPERFAMIDAAQDPQTVWLQVSAAARTVVDSGALHAAPGAYPASGSR